MDKHDRSFSSYAPEKIYVIDVHWLSKFKKYVRYTDLKSMMFKKETYLQRLTSKHIEETHPGVVDTSILLKDFNKYVRDDDDIDDPTNRVIRGIC
jgi:hypothetical protein